MSQTLELTMRRVEDGIVRVMDTERSSRDVMRQIIADGAPMLMRYKSGRAPTVEQLERIAIKLLAVAVATEEALKAGT